MKQLMCGTAIALFTSPVWAEGELETLTLKDPQRMYYCDSLTALIQVRDGLMQEPANQVDMRQSFPQICDYMKNENGDIWTVEQIVNVTLVEEEVLTFLPQTISSRLYKTTNQAGRDIYFAIFFKKIGGLYFDPVEPIGKMPDQL